MQPYARIAIKTLKFWRTFGGLNGPRICKGAGQRLAEGCLDRTPLTGWFAGTLAGWVMARYEIVAEESVVDIEASSSVHPIHSKAAGLTGFVEMDGDRLVGGAVSFPVSRLRASNPLEEREMKRRIDARRYPTIDGVVTAVEARGDGRFGVTGDVTFRGQARRHEDEVTVETIDDETVKVTGSSRFDVRDHGMEPPKVLLLRVHPEVTVRIEVVARRQAAGPRS